MNKKPSNPKPHRSCSTSSSQPPPSLSPQATDRAASADGHVGLVCGPSVLRPAGVLVPSAGTEHNEPANHYGGER